MSKENKIIIGGAVIIIAIVSIFVFSSSAGKNIAAQNKQGGFYEGEMPLEKLSEISSCPLTSDKDAFAKCLTDKGFAMYGAYWCPHCQDQKNLFGDSFKYIKYVECTEQTQLCTDKGVQGFPTWIVESTSTDYSTSSIK